MSNLRDLKKDLNFLSEELRLLVSVKVFVEHTDVSKAEAALAKVDEYERGHRESMQAGRRLKELDRRATAKSRRGALREVRQAMLEGYDKLAEEIGAL